MQLCDTNVSRFKDLQMRSKTLLYVSLGSVNYYYGLKEVNLYYRPGEEKMTNTMNIVYRNSLH